MKNEILYHYNIYVSSLNEESGNYSFIYDNSSYFLQFFDRPLEDLDYLYELNQEMIRNGVTVHRIIPCTDNSLMMFINNKPYVLLKLVRLDNRKININDILLYNYIPSSRTVNKLNKSNWSSLWGNKIDYIEYQFSQMNKKYPLISESINYYLGMWENAISFFNDNKTRINSRLCVCHKRLSINDTLNDFYNPLYFLIDYKERDVASYLKSKVINQEKIDFDSYFSYFNPFLLISRLLFPSYYFDLYEKIIGGSIDEIELNKIISLSSLYEAFLEDVFNYYKGVIPINWLIKKELDN